MHFFFDKNIFFLYNFMKGVFICTSLIKGYIEKGGECILAVKKKATKKKATKKKATKKKATKKTAKKKKKK